MSYKKVTTAQKGAYFFCAKILAMITMQQVRAIKNTQFRRKTTWHYQTFLDGTRRMSSRQGQHAEQHAGHPTSRQHVAHKVRRTLDLSRPERSVDQRETSLRHVEQRVERPTNLRHVERHVGHLINKQKF